MCVWCCHMQLCCNPAPGMAAEYKRRCRAALRDATGETGATYAPASKPANKLGAVVAGAPVGLLTTLVWALLTGLALWQEQLDKARCANKVTERRLALVEDALVALSWVAVGRANANANAAAPTTEPAAGAAQAPLFLPNKEANAVPPPLEEKEAKEEEGKGAGNEAGKK
jgi:hypothetical protein